MSLRVEPYTVGDFVHIYNRGVKKEPIFWANLIIGDFCGV
jgi:hypothetical protein